MALFQGGQGVRWHRPGQDGQWRRITGCQEVDHLALLWRERLDPPAGQIELACFRQVQRPVDGAPAAALHNPASSQGFRDEQLAVSALAPDAAWMSRTRAGTGGAGSRYSRNVRSWSSVRSSSVTIDNCRATTDSISSIGSCRSERWLASILMSGSARSWLMTHRDVPSRWSTLSRTTRIPLAPGAWLRSASRQARTMFSGDTLAPAGNAGANTLPMPNFIRRQDAGMLCTMTVSWPESTSAAAAMSLLRPDPAGPVTMTPELSDPVRAVTAARSSAARITGGKADSCPNVHGCAASLAVEREDSGPPPTHLPALATPTLPSHCSRWREW